MYRPYAGRCGYSNFYSTPENEKDSDEQRLAHSLNNVMRQPHALDNLESLTSSVMHRCHHENPLSPSKGRECFDLAVILRALRRKMDEEGILQSYSGISFQCMTLKGSKSGSSRASSLGTILKTLATLPFAITRKRGNVPKVILEDADGLIRAGEMCLVLGQPGAGCTSLLKALAGEVSDFKEISGNILYEGISQKEMLKNFRSEVIYCSESDEHFPHLTVEQTLRFAISCRTPRTRLSTQTRKEFVQNQLDILSTVFGLRHVLNTKVGNDLIRGISGGERRRLSIAEAFATRASIYCWDNATRGLDSSTALEYVKAIRAYTNILGNVGILAIYQAGDSIFQYFDKVCILYEGRQIFFGPSILAKSYFIRMGYECPERQTTTDFLTAVTDPRARFARRGFESRVPETPQEFVAYWKSSPEYARLKREITAYITQVSPHATLKRFRSVDADAKMKGTRRKSQYLLTYTSQLYLVVKRGFQRLKGDLSFHIIKLVGTLIQSVVVGTLFYDIADSTNGALSRGSVIYFTLLFNTLGALAEITVSFANRPIILKQRKYSLYHPSVEALQAILTESVSKIFLTIIFCTTVYFLCGLKRDAASFFSFLLLILISNYAMTSIFQTLATIVNTPAAANALAGIGILSLVVYTGYMIPAPKMHAWFRWINIIDPLAYGFQGLMVNEFHERDMPCDTMIPSGLKYANISRTNQACAVAGARPEQNYVTGDDYLDMSYGYHWKHIWRNMIIIAATWLFFSFLTALATEKVRGVRSNQTNLQFKHGHSSRFKAGKPVKAVEGRNARKTAKGPSGSESNKTFTWSDLSYEISESKSSRLLLDNVSGYVKPGTMTALMGESGAGKTTLLNILSQRVTSGKLYGNILVDGKEVDHTFHRNVGYVQQQDLHMAQLTVRESLQFAARLRQPSHVADSEKLAYADRIISLLGMQHFSDALVGEPRQGLNVEQRKKLSIGVELVAKPSLLIFLDEPTSGLDSQSAWSIISLLRSLADSGQSILCTIHQPSAILFEQFDKLLLLKQGGQTVYFGDIGRRSQTLCRYFERHGARPCHPNENPAEYALDCISVEAPTTSPDNWCRSWSLSFECYRMRREIEKVTSHRPVAYSRNAKDRSNCRFAAPYTTQLRCVYMRQVKKYWRSPKYIMAKLMLMLFASLFVGFSFWKTDNTIMGMRNILFSLFLIQIIANPLTNQIHAYVITDRDLFEAREHASNTFHWSILVISQYFAELPYHIVFSSLFFAIYHTCLGFNMSPQQVGLFYVLYCILYQLYYVAFALAVLYMSPSAAGASMINAILFSFVVAFCGVLQPKALIPKFWTFMYYLSPYTYFIQSHLSVVLHKRAVVCADSELITIKPPSGQTCSSFMQPWLEQAGGYLKNPAASERCQYCMFSDGDQYSALIHARYDQRWRNMGIICLYIGFNLVALLGLFWLFRIRKAETKIRVHSSTNDARESCSLEQRSPTESNFSGGSQISSFQAIGASMAMATDVDPLTQMAYSVDGEVAWASGEPVTARPAYTSPIRNLSP